jgi:predicted nucleic acid-binding protein
MQLDRGEASALALALETPDSTVIIDDYRARRAAKNLGITFTGTIGVIIKAKPIGVIPTIKPLLSKIKKQTLE